MNREFTKSIITVLAVPLSIILATTFLVAWFGLRPSLASQSCWEKAAKEMTAYKNPIYTITENSSKYSAIYKFCMNSKGFF